MANTINHPRAKEPRVVNASAYLTIPEYEALGRHVTRINMSQSNWIRRAILDRLDKEDFNGDLRTST